MPTSLFATSGALGVALGQVFTPDTSSVTYVDGLYPNLALGTRVTATDSSVWVLVLMSTGGITGDGYVCTFDENFTAVMLSTSNDVYGKPVGVPICGAAVAGDYVWLQIAGTCSAIRGVALTAANVPLLATATAGEIDDGVTTGLFIRNMVYTTAVGASAGTAEGQLNFPLIDTFPTAA